MPSNILYQDLLKYGLRIGNEQMKSLGMTGHFHPLSITEDEFHFIRDFVQKNGYRSAYELATAFGVSAAAIGLGLKPNGGKLVSVDAYVEEEYNLATAYRDRPRRLNEDPDGLKIAKQLRTHFGLEETVDFRIGWSPDDIPAILEDRGLDFVFIDGNHWDECLLADLGTVKDRLRPPFTVMVHDCHAFSPETLQTVAGWLKADLTKPSLPRTFNLGYYQRQA